MTAQLGNVRSIGFRTLFMCAALSAPGAAGGAATAQTPPRRDAWSGAEERAYFASPEAEARARADVDSAARRLEQFATRLATGAQLVAGIEAYEDVLRLYRRHDGYLHLQCARNRTDVACVANARLGSQVSASTALFEAAILAIPPARLHALLSTTPRLAAYAFALDDMRRVTPHRLPRPDEALLDRLDPELTGWQEDLHQQILAAIPFGTVQTAAGPRDVIRERNLLATDPDPRVREQAFKRRLEGLASQRDLLAFALLHTVRAQTILAELHHYPDAPARKYASLYQDPAATRALLTWMAQHGVVAQRFERIRAADFQRDHGQTLEAWDMSVPVALDMPVTPLADARRLFHEAFAGLGPEYQAVFDSLLDPATGRADIRPGGAPGRYLSGFSIGFPGSPSMLFVGGYDGTFKDLSVIAHEGGHAAHRALMAAHGVRPLYAEGPSFLSESFAVFNELVLADYLAEHASDPRLARFYRERWLGIKGLDAFYGAQDALLEQQIYDGVAADSVRGADDLDRVTTRVDEQFSIFPATTPSLRTRWAAVSLMYEDPLYDVNYVYGGLLALKYFQLYSASHEHFAPRYLALLKNGFDATPRVLLNRFLDIDLSDKSLGEDDLTVLNQRLDQLERSE